MKTESIGFKIIIVVFLSALLITAALGVLSFNFSKERLVSMLGESIKGIAITSASFISTSDMLTIILTAEKKRIKYYPSREEGFSTAYGKTLSANVKIDEVKLRDGVDTYNKYVALLSNIKNMNRIDGPINVYVKDAGRLKLVLSSDKAMLVGAEYKISPTALAVFSTGSAQATGIYKDKDGTWISAYAPVSTERNMIIEVNYKIDSYLNRLMAELWVILVTCLVVFILSILISNRFIARTVSSIKKLTEIATELGKGNYDIVVDMKSRDEIGHLAETFEKLRSSIKTKISELRLSLAREKKAHLESIIALTNAISLRDPALGKHVYRVEKYALLIAKVMRLPKVEIEKLKYGCYLHDIGKLELETSVLQKVKLSKEDYEQVKGHSEKGAKIIEGIEFLDEIRGIVLSHQESYDGTGYPRGLKGDEIPLLARIVTVADAFDAMTTDRPYQPKINFHKAMDKIESKAGIQFDPEVCRALLSYRDQIEEIVAKHFK